MINLYKVKIGYRAIPLFLASCYMTVISFNKTTCKYRSCMITEKEEIKDSIYNGMVLGLNTAIVIYLPYLIYSSLKN